MNLKTMIKSKKNKTQQKSLKARNNPQNLKRILTFSTFGENTTRGVTKFKKINNAKYVIQL